MTPFLGGSRPELLGLYWIMPCGSGWPNLGIIVLDSQDQYGTCYGVDPGKPGIL